MPLILIVDDSPSDQAIFEELVKKENLDWVVEFSDSGEQAMVRMKELKVDLVVTDMMMPGMDGLAVLDFVRKEHKEVPVILATGQGSESLAVEALRRGAASYVPKMELTKRLTETIKQVLQIVQSRQNYNVLIESVSYVQVQFTLENQPALILPLVNLIQQLAFGVKLFRSEGRRQLGIALDEAILNAMFHGNLELPRTQLTQTRAQLRDGQRVEAMEKRRLESPYCERRVFVEALVSPHQARITVRDQGRGFDPSMQTAEHPDTDSNRGLVLIRNLMDLVEFNESGNEIVMIKHAEANVDESPAALLDQFDLGKPTA